MTPRIRLHVGLSPTTSHAHKKVPEELHKPLRAFYKYNEQTDHTSTPSRISIFSSQILNRFQVGYRCTARTAPLPHARRPQTETGRYWHAKMRAPTCIPLLFLEVDTLLDELAGLHLTPKARAPDTQTLNPYLCSHPNPHPRHVERGAAIMCWCELARIWWCELRRSRSLPPSKRLLAYLRVSVLINLRACPSRVFNNTP